METAVNWQSVIATAIVTIPPTLIAAGTLWVAIKQGAKEAAEQAAAAAAAAAEVKATLAATVEQEAEKLARIEKVTTDTLTHVNHSKGLLLKATAVALRNLAVVTNNKKDLDAAELAEKDYEAHLAGQAVVDAKNAMSDR